MLALVILALMGKPNLIIVKYCLEGMDDLGSPVS